MKLCFVKVSTTEKLSVATQCVPRTVLLYVDNSKSWQILMCGPLEVRQTAESAVLGLNPASSTMALQDT